MDRINPTIWAFILPIAVVVSFLILIGARLILRLLLTMIRWFDAHLPRRLAVATGLIAFSLIIWGLWTEVLVDGSFAVANRFFAPLDSTTDRGIAAPESTNRSGGPGSLIPWETLGRQGRNFVASGPTRADLNEFHGAGSSLEPIRVYAGLRSAETVAERAQLVLDELIRTDAFDRQVMVIASTTGTGKLESNAMDALEYVTNGDVAVAGVQYSYLPSVLSLLADADEVRETSLHVFDTIHGYWSTLPAESRPEIYVYGLSLGSYGVESILTSIDIVNEPIDGALMVGPPFVDELWNRVVDERDPGSAPTLPVFEDGRTVRFANERAGAAHPTTDWGPTRILYLQHASDPVVFFRPDVLLKQPDWLFEDQRGDEISEGFIWIPFVTMWQLLGDLATAGSVPEGFGHLYTPQANADAWIAVTRPDNWKKADTERLKTHLANS
jgi:uncharacterized membrane protein